MIALAILAVLAAIVYLTAPQVPVRSPNIIYIVLLITIYFLLQTIFSSKLNIVLIVNQVEYHQHF